MAPKSTTRKARQTRKMDKIDRLVAMAAQECGEAGIALIFKDAEADRGQNQGSFSNHHKELIIMTQEEEWVQVLAHELSHLRQAREGFFVSEDEYEMFEDWMTGRRKLEMSEVIRCTRYVQLCELDAEMRSLAILKELKLLTAAEQKIYIQKANCYCLLWEIARRHKRWTNPKTPAICEPKIYKLLPTKWIEDVSIVPDEFEAAVIDKCYG